MARSKSSGVSIPCSIRESPLQPKHRADKRKEDVASTGYTGKRQWAHRAASNLRFPFASATIAFANHFVEVPRFHLLQTPATLIIAGAGQN